MIPKKTIEDLINKHSLLEKELSSGNVDKKLFAEKSKEYSDLNEIVEDAKKYISFEKEKNEIEKILEEKLSHIKTPLTLSIIGCVVNGPGEAAMTDIGITGGGKGNNMLYLSGIQSEKVLSEDIISRVVSEVEKKAAELDKKL